MCRINKGFTPLETSVKKASHRKFLTGFTLIETLLVTAMFSIIALAIYSSFSQGIKLWQRLTKSTPASGLNIFFAKISSDLRNSFGFSGINFVGTENNIAFAALVLSARGGQQEVLSIGQIGYSFDAQTGSLNRWEKNYNQLYQNKPTLPRQMVDNVGSLNFHYYYYDSEQKIYIWKDTWQEEGRVPLAVRIRAGFNEDAKRKEITRTFTLPAGG